MNKIMKIAPSESLHDLPIRKKFGIKKFLK